MSTNLHETARDGESGVLIVVLLILLLLGGLGAGAYWFLGQRRQAAVQMEIQAMEAERAASEARHAADLERKSKSP
jgi:uncharacterized protein HemX